MSDIGYDGADISDIYYYNSSASTENITFACDYNKSTQTGSTTTWYVDINSYTFDVVKARIRIYEYTALPSPKNFYLRSTGAWQTITSSGLKSFTESVYIAIGDIIGIEFEITNTSGSQKTLYLGANNSTFGYDVFFENGVFIDGSAYGAGNRWDDIILDQSIILYASMSSEPPDPDPESGGDGDTDIPVDTCRLLGGPYEIGEYFDNYWGTNGGYIQDIDTISSPTRALISVEMPWGYEKYVNEILLGNTTYTYDNPNNANEHYSLKIQIFDGSPDSVYDIYECWWMETSDGSKYVKASGNDSYFGNTWGTAYRTVGKGFQNVGSDGSVTVEEGYYGGETLSNLNPPQTMSMNIQSGSHTEAPTTVMVSGDALTTNFTSARNDSINWANLTYLQRSSSIAANGTIYAFEFKAGAVGFNGSLKFKILRLIGSNYEYIGGTDAFTHTLDAGEIVSNVVVDGIDVQSGDLIAMFVAGATKVTYATSGGASMFAYGVFGYDVVGTTPTSAWGDTSLSYSIGVKTYGI